jgi:hypothetical protein
VDEREHLLFDSAIKAFLLAEEFRRGAKLLPKKFPDLINARFHLDGELSLQEGRLAIITASNPSGMALSSRENQQRTPAFQEDLRRTAVHRGSLRVGPEGSESLSVAFLIKADEKRAIEISKEQGQGAFFMVCGGERVVLIGCNGEGKLELGKFQDLIDRKP